MPIPGPSERRHLHVAVGRAPPHRQPVHGLREPHVPGAVRVHRCTGPNTETVELGTRGTLWTWTVQGFPPKAPPYVGDTDPQTFLPFGVGYVELPGEVQGRGPADRGRPAAARASAWRWSSCVVPLTIDDDGNEVVTFAFAPHRPVRGGRTMSDDVAIVGIGMHEFGRHDGVSGMDQGVIAVRRALADAGVRWDDMQFAFGGSQAAGAADTMVVRARPHRAAVHQRRQRVRHRRLGAVRRLQHDPCRRMSTSASRSASTSTSAARSASTPASAGLGDWYGASGLALTTQFFGMKINRYMHEYGITPLDAGARWRPRRSATVAQPDGVAPQAAVGGRDPRLADAVVPADAVHVLLARRGRRGADPVPRRPGPPLHRSARLPARPPSCASPAVRQLRGARPVDRARARRRPDGRRVEGRVRDGRHRSRRHRRRPAAGHRGGRRGHAHGRERLLRARRAGGA